MHFLGLKWNNENYLPHIQYRDVANNGEVKFWELKPESNITININRERFCTGYFSNPEYNKVACRHNISLEGKTGFQCPECQHNDSALFLPLNSLNDFQRNIVKGQRHLNYINLFGEDLIKVGVAAQVRKYTRVHEQGAHASLFIAESDGIIAREIEELISHRLNIKQSINVSTKANVLYQYLPKDEVRRKLIDTYFKAVSILKENYGKYLINEPEFTYNIDFYNLKNKENIIYYLTDIDGIKQISGTIKSVIGELLILSDTQNRLIAFNSKFILGRLIKVNSEKNNFNVSSDKLKKITYEKPLENLTLF